MKNKMPLGLKIILILSVLGAVLSSWSFLQGNYRYDVALPNGLTSLAPVITILIFFSQFAWILSILKRYKWGWILFIATSIFTSYNVIIGEITRGFAIQSIAPLFTLVLMSIASVYIYRIRVYFNR